MREGKQGLSEGEILLGKEQDWRGGRIEKEVWRSTSWRRRKGGGGKLYHKEIQATYRCMASCDILNRPTNQKLFDQRVSEHKRGGGRHQRQVKNLKTRTSSINFVRKAKTRKEKNSRRT